MPALRIGVRAAAVTTVVVGALALCTGAIARMPKPAALIAPWGLDLAARDVSVKPGDDFYRYADGRWLDSHQIPADRSRWGSFDELNERTQQQVHDIVAALPADAPAGSNVRKVVDYYRAFLDSAAIERAGLQPAQAALKAIAAAQSPRDLSVLIGRPELGLSLPLRLQIMPDQKDPDRYMVTVSQSGLGMPNRDYYLKDDPVYARLRQQYAAHVERILKLAGSSDPAGEAHSVLELEIQIARLHWPAAKVRDRDLSYNPRTRAELAQATPGFAWDALLDGQGVGAQPRFIVRQPDAVAGIAQLFTEVPVAHWRAYLTYHYLQQVAEVLPAAFDDEVFDFYGRTLAGQPQQRERWKRAVAALDRDLGEAVGALYVQRYFPPESRRQVLALVENLRAAYGEHIKHLPWMIAATRKVALAKLAAFHPKIGYPDTWRDYSALSIIAGDAFGNAERGRVFEWQRQVQRLGSATDRAEWGMTPQTINAYYNSTFNEVVFPAAILQAPFFDPNADPAVNYGGIGVVIGHEMGHGFDDQGAKSDARGVLHTWWLPEDTAAFRQRTDRLAQQYDSYQALPGLHLNGRLTLGENIGDLGGISVAYDAWRRALAGRSAPLRDGLSGPQRFFLSFAQVWRGLIRDEQLRKQVLSDPHSPPQFRVNGVVRNVDAWYDAFDVKPGERLYLAPAERVRIW